MDRLDHHDKPTRNLKEFVEFGHRQEEATRSEHSLEASRSEHYVGSSLMWQRRESSRSQQMEEPTIDSMELENNTENSLGLAMGPSKGRSHTHTVESILGFDDRTRCAVCHQPMAKRRFHYGGIPCLLFYPMCLELPGGNLLICFQHIFTQAQTFVLLRTFNPCMNCLGFPTQVVFSCPQFPAL